MTMSTKDEAYTLKLMLVMYCREHHGVAEDLCENCRELLAYAAGRLARCPLGDRRTTCGKCPIHCYRPDMKESIVKVMRYAGPRMARHHPWLALKHFWRARFSRRGGVN
ncbi:MAG TPA: nitrous oxide-stimulated promoter family protein [Proteobacteria bacterium]|nr:nitrous oxide-stimulated promoter family protein [Pseudomonadota bacterium]